MDRSVGRLIFAFRSSLSFLPSGCYIKGLLIYKYWPWNRASGMICEKRHSHNSAEGCQQAQCSVRQNNWGSCHGCLPSPQKEDMYNPANDLHQIFYYTLAFICCRMIICGNNMLIASNPCLLSGDSYHPTICEQIPRKIVRDGGCRRSADSAILMVRPFSVTAVPSAHT